MPSRWPSDDLAELPALGKERKNSEAEQSGTEGSEYSVEDEEVHRLWGEAEKGHQDRSRWPAEAWASQFGGDEWRVTVRQLLLAKLVEGTAAQSEWILLSMDWLGAVEGHEKKLKGAKARRLAFVASCRTASARPRHC